MSDENKGFVEVKGKAPVTKWMQKVSVISIVILVLGYTPLTNWFGPENIVLIGFVLMIVGLVIYPLFNRERK